MSWFDVNDIPDNHLSEVISRNIQQQYFPNKCHRPYRISNSRVRKAICDISRARRRKILNFSCVRSYGENRLITRGLWTYILVSASGVETGMSYVISATTVYPDDLLDGAGPRWGIGDGGLPTPRFAKRSGLPKT